MLLPTSMNPPLEHMRLVLYVQTAALRFIQGIGYAEAPKPSLEVAQAGYRIDPTELACMVRSHDIETLELHGGVEGIAKKLSVLLENGVYTSSIVRRSKIFGVNQFIEKPARPFLLFLWDALQDTTLIILIVCAVASVAVGISTEGWPKGMYDGLGIVLCISLVVIVTAISDYKQSLQFRDLNKEKVNMQVHVTRNGCRQKISIFEVVVGDIVHLSIGDQVPADGIFVSGYSLAVDESSLSGESEPVNKNKERPFLLSGTKVQDGSGKMLVTSVGMSTEWGKLMATLTEGGEDETPLQVKLNGVATIIGKIGLSFAVLTFLILTARFLITKGRIQGGITKWSMNDALSLLNFFAIAVTILVVAVPEGLPLAVTLSLAFAMKKLMNERALVRHLSACETMGSVSCICTDKTGTLTTNHMVVRKIWICGETKTVDEQNNLEKTLESCISEAAIFVLLQSIFKNTSAEIVKGNDGKENVLGSPTETALLELGSLLRGNHAARLKEIKILKVEPFNSNKKKMSVFVSFPGGRVRAFCKGASELILETCDKMLDKDGKSVPLYEEQRNYLKDVINGFASESLRTLCLAFNDDGTLSADTFPDNNYTLVAIIGIKDPLRRGVKEAVRTCLDAGITVRMVTGDNIMTAKSIATECGIYTAEGIAMEGDEFRSKSNEELKEIIPKLQVLARSMPLDKHKLVTFLREEYKDVVAVTGDGTNDAPALHEADIGLAMGIAGTEVAKESADVVILDDNFSTIVNLAKWGRSVYINIQKFVQFQLTVNVVALMANFMSACISGSAPLTTVQLLWVNMIMDTLGALALATEPPHDALMKQPPIGRNVGFITKIMWRNIIGQGIYQLAILGVLEFQGKRLFNLNGSDSNSILNTLIFNTFVFCQVFNEINSRDMEKINVFRGIFQSWIFMIVIVSTVAFQVIIVEFLGAFADTVPLNWQLWLASVLMGAGSLLIAVVLKCIPVSMKEIKKPISNVKQQHDGYEPLPTGPDSV